MKLQDIRYVISVAENLSFSKASEKLFVSQPALSKAILKLENELGIKIFDRNRHKVVLTDCGKYFISEGQKILNDFDHFEYNLNELSKANEKRLRIGASQFYSNYLCAEFIPKYQTSHPEIKLLTREEPTSILKKLVLSNELDIAIIPSDDEVESFNVYPLYDEMILLAVSKLSPYSKIIKSVDNKHLKWPTMSNFSDLKTAPFHLLREEMSLSIHGTKICNYFGFEPNVVNRSQNMENINKYVSYGQSLAFLSHIITPLPNIDYYHIDNPLAIRQLVFITDKKKSLQLYHHDLIKLGQEILSSYSE